MKRILPSLKKIISYSYVILFISLASCSQYKVISYPEYEDQKLTDVEKNDAKYIVHQNGAMYELTEATTDSVSISGVLKPIEQGQVYFNDKGATKVKSKEKAILNEIHVYLKGNASALQQGQVKISMEKVKDVKFVKRDMKILGFVIGGLAVAMFALLLLM
jgi:hypothetical protein